MKRFLIVVLSICLFVNCIVVTSFAGVCKPCEELKRLRGAIAKVQDIDDAILEQIQTAMLQKYSDINASGGYLTVMAKMVGISAMDGYQDKIFPNDKVTRAQFLLMFIRPLVGLDVLNNTVSDFSHYGAKAIKKAEELGLISKGEYTLANCDQPIPRGEIAKIIARAYSKYETNPKSYEAFKPLIPKIKDYNTISANIQPFVLIVYGAGVVNGYPNGNFGAADSATRAQAAWFVIRFLDSRERLKVEIPASSETRAPTTLAYNDPDRPLPIAGDTFVKPDGTQIVLEVGPSGVLGENQNCDIYGGMAYPNGSLVEHGKLGTQSLGHLGETYLVDQYGEGHWWSEWKVIQQYYFNKVYEEIKEPKDGQTYGKWLKYFTDSWCWIGPVNQ